MNAPLALPPPRRTLTPRACSHTPDHWQRDYHEAVRAMAYETTLLPSEKDAARWTELRYRSAYFEGLLKHRRAAA